MAETGPDQVIPHDAEPDSTAMDDSPDTSSQSFVPLLWRAHDVVVGLLAGFGAGAIAGLFAMRLVDSSVVPAVGAAIGAMLGALALFRSRHQGDGFLNPFLVIAWVVLVLSAGFITLLVVAIANFE